MTKFLFAILLTSLCIISWGQLKTDKDKERINSSCDKFMQTFVEGKFSEAIQTLKITSLIDQGSIDTLDKQVNEQMKGVLPVYKRLIGYELIEDKAIKNTVVQRRYLLKFQEYFLVFNFILYNNGASWTIINFNYKDDVHSLF